MPRQISMIFLIENLMEDSYWKKLQMSINMIKLKIEGAKGHKIQGLCSKPKNPTHTCMYIFVSCHIKKKTYCPKTISFIYSTY